MLLSAQVQCVGALRYSQLVQKKATAHHASFCFSLIFSLFVFLFASTPNNGGFEYRFQY